MSSQIELIKRKFSRAALKRKRGRALLRKGRQEEARKAFADGVKLFEEGLEGFEDSAWHGIDLEAVPTAPLSAEQLDAAKLWAEGLGSKGGLLRRLGQFGEAVDSYERGSRVEDVCKLASTYNRVNFIMNSLQVDPQDRRRRRLDELQERIETVASLLDDQLRRDRTLSDKGWAWADLGHCLALQGDVDGAANAYRNFISKAPSQAPESTLAVLEGVANAIGATDPEAAERLQEVVEDLKERFASSTVS